MLKNPTDIKGLIETQFPDYYREEGRRFVDFVTLYYEWMENKTQRVHHIINPRKEYVQVRHNNNQVIGVGTVFSNVFSRSDYAEDSIAIYKSNNDYDYEIFKIASVANDTLIYLTDDKLPQFSSQRAWHGHVKSQPNPSYYTRRNFDILDIDATFDEFIVYYKEQYLKNIQFNTITDTKTLVKNSLDLYRSKGTPRAVNLLFKIAFGVPAEVFYPQVDIFKTSSADWYIPEYLELIPSENNVLFVNRQIVGLKSGATAFIQNVVRKTVKNRIVDIAYISAINGTFETGEKFNIESDPLDISFAPTIIGSLNEIDLDQGGFSSGYAVGDTFELESEYGDQAFARVSEISNSSGELTYILTDGGYGFSANAEVLVSNNIIRISNISGTDLTYFDDFETLVQPLANITYVSASSANAWVDGDAIYAYDGGGNVIGQGVALVVTESNTTAGEMFVAISNGSLDQTILYTEGNTASAAKSTYTDKTVTANAMGTYANVFLQVSNISGTFENNEEIKSDTNGNGIFGSISNVVGTNATLNIVNCSSFFEVGQTITGQNSNTTANVVDIEISLGVIDLSNAMIALDGNYVYGNSLFTSGTINFVSTGSGASVSFSNNLLYTEVIPFNTDYITANGTHYGPIALNASQFDFPADPAGNLTSNTIDNLLTYANTTIGKIQLLTSQNPGDGYNARPLVRILEPFVFPFKKVDEKYIEVSNTSSFLVGEVITQDATNFRGLIKEANSTVIIAEKLRFYDNNDVISTTNTGTILVGESTGATANVDSVEDYPLISDLTLINRQYLGYNTEIDIDVIIANGVVTGIEVVDSGFGFKSQENIYVKGNTDTVVGYANLQTHGTGRGFYKSNDGFLSDVKKLQDGHYWQTHSYEVRSSIGLEKYREMLKEVVHVAGHVFFGNLVHFSISNNNIIAGNTDYSNNLFTATVGDLLEVTGDDDTVVSNSDMIDSEVLASVWSDTGDGFAMVLEGDDVSITIRDSSNTDNSITTRLNEDYDAFNSILDYVGPSEKMVRAPDGYWKYAPHNLFTNSDFSVTYWTKTQVTSVTANAGIAPDGTNTAFKFTPDGTNNDNYLIPNESPTNKMATFSYYVKSTGSINNMAGLDNAVDYVFFDIANGEIYYDNTGSDFIASIEPANNGWFKITMTAMYDSVQNLRIVTIGYNDSQFAFNGTTDHVLIWGPQLSHAPVMASDPLITSGSTRYGLPIQYYANGTAEGLITEREATNRIPYSYDFNNSGVWANTDATATANVVTAPNGILEGYEFTEGSVANTVHYITDAVTANTTNDREVIGSIYAKRNTRDHIYLALSGTSRTGGASFNLVTGEVRDTFLNTFTSVTPGMEYVGNDWWRCWINVDADASGNVDSFYISMDDGIGTLTSTGPRYDGDGNSSVYIWGAQVEEIVNTDTSDKASSYILTSGSAVTRNSDRIEKNGTEFNWNTEAGSVFLENNAYKGRDTSQSGIDLYANSTEKLSIRHNSTFANRLGVSSYTDTHIRLNEDLERIAIAFDDASHISSNGSTLHEESAGGMIDGTPYYTISADRSTALTPTTTLKQSLVIPNKLSNNYLNAITQDIINFPAIDGIPIIQGVPAVSEILTAEAANLVANTYGDNFWQWYRNGIEITGANSITYTVTANDVGYVLSVEQITKNGRGVNTAFSNDTITVIDDPLSFYTTSGDGLFVNFEGDNPRIVVNDSANTDNNVDISLLEDYAAFNDFFDQYDISPTMLRQSDGLLKYGPHNRLHWSEDYTAWTQGLAVATLQPTVTPPTGLNTVHQILANAGTSTYNGRIVGWMSEIYTGITYKVVWYVKAGTSQYGWILFGNNHGRYWFDLTNELINATGLDAGTTYSLTAVGDSWYKVEIDWVSDGSDSSVAVWLGATNTYGDPATSRTLAGTESIYVSEGHIYMQPADPTYIASTSNGTYAAVPIEWDLDGKPKWTWGQGYITNQLEYSEPNHTNASWSNTAQIDSTANSGVAPDGSNTAMKISEDNTAAQAHHFSTDDPASLTGSTAYTFSVYLKAAEYQWVQLTGATANFGSDVYVNYNLFTGEMGNTGVDVEYVNMKYHGDGWWRCIIHAFSVASPGGGVTFTIGLTDNQDGARLPSYDGDGSSGVLAWGAQLCQRRWEGKFIRTNGATVTSTPDDFRIPLSKLPWSETELSWLADFQTQENANNTDYILSRASNCRYAYTNQGDNGTYYSYYGGATTGWGIPSAGTRQKWAQAIANNGVDTRHQNYKNGSIYASENVLANDNFMLESIGSDLYLGSYGGTIYQGAYKYVVVPESWSSNQISLFTKDYRPVFDDIPVVSGNPVVGHTLTATPATVNTSYGLIESTEYQWFRSNTAISGANTLTYILTANDLGETITFRHTEINSLGNTSVTSLATDPISNSMILLWG